MMKIKETLNVFWEEQKSNFIKNRVCYFKFFSIVLEIFLILNSIVLIYSIWKIDLSRMPSAFSLFFLLATQVFATIAVLSFSFFGWISKNEQLKLFRKMFLTILFIIIFAFPSAYLILYIGQTLSRTQGVQIGSADGWLGFIGSLFGGVITMLAVLFTFQYQKYLDTMKSIPTLSIKLIDENRTFSAKVKDIETITVVNSIRFEIKNNSNHIAKEFKINDISFRAMGSDNPVNELSEEFDEFLKSGLSESILNPNQTIIFQHLINKNIKDDMFYKLSIEGEYFDYLKYKKFTFSFLCFILIDIESEYRANLVDHIGGRIPCRLELVTTKFRLLNH